MSFISIILAGGKSSRMGTNKSIIEIDGIPMILRVMNSLKKAGCSKFILQIKNNTNKEHLKHLMSNFDVTWNYDESNENDLISAINSGLMLAKKMGWKFAQLAPVDTPYVSSGLFEILSKKIYGDYDIIIPKSKDSGDGLEPLLSYVKIKPLLDKFSHLAPGKKVSLSDLYCQMKHKIIKIDELKEVGVSNRNFKNFNSLNDLQ